MLQISLGWESQSRSGCGKGGISLVKVVKRDLPKVGSLP